MKTHNNLQPQLTWQSSLIHRDDELPVAVAALPDALAAPVAQ